MRKLLPVVLGAVLLATTGCGSSDSGSTGNGKADPNVATLHSDTATATTSAAPAQRPLLRPDASDDEVIALENAWTHCLGEHGVPLMPAQPGAVQKPKDEHGPQYKEATAACANLEPEDWRDVEARTDPQYADRLRVEVQCFKEKGIHAELRGQPPQLVFADDREVPRALDVTPECEKRAFGDVMKTFNEK
jgi:hypothetical protein